MIDQSPIGNNVRANTATYSKIFDNIRKIFASSNNMKDSLFTFNGEGACEECKRIRIYNNGYAFFRRHTHYLS